MLKQTDLTTTARLFSTAGTFGEIALVASHERILLDVQGRTYGVDGHLYVDHALAFLPLQTAKRLRDLLSEAICVAEQTGPRQPGLWRQATTRAIASQVRQPGRDPAHPAADARGDAVAGPIGKRLAHAIVWLDEVNSYERNAEDAATISQSAAGQATLKPDIECPAGRRFCHDHPPSHSTLLRVHHGIRCLAPRSAMAR